jgi:hypothetical protein
MRIPVDSTDRTKKYFSNGTVPSGQRTIQKEAVKSGTRRITPKNLLFQW